MTDTTFTTDPARHTAAPSTPIRSIEALLDESTELLLAVRLERI